MKLDFNFDNKKTYIVAVSFGPDSMCLLDMLRNETNNLVVAHVNYHRRPESNSEQDRLEEYCKEHKIRIEVLDTKNLKPTGNFQKWAREIRYKFFAELEKKYKAECIFVAHQQDDLIETFLMQKNKKNFVKYWGIAEKNIVKRGNIVRPLLNYSKKELQEYCDKNNVPYAIDSSNLEDHYTRNKIRHSLVEKMSKSERDKIVSEIKTLNSNKQHEFNTMMGLDFFLNLSYENIVLFISDYLHSQNVHKDISSSFVNSIKTAFLSNNPNVLIQLEKGFVIAKEYDEVFLYNLDEEKKYSYVLNNGDVIDNKDFYIDFGSYFSERNVLPDSFPLTIKPISSDDQYQIKNYLCKVRRLLIDWKVPHHLRNSWPGIYDKNGVLIYIPRYRKNFSDNHKSKFVIKFSK